MSQGFKLWKGGQKTKDYYFQDRIAEEHIRRSGTSFLLHKYIGPFEQDSKDSTLFLPKNPKEINEMVIQDVLLGENRDRRYSEDIIELTGTYNLNDAAFDISQFGMLQTGDSIIVEFHLNDHIEKVGRRLMTGDVIEVVHMRDDTSLDGNSPPIKKFYVIKEAIRPTTGFAPTWHNHIWRVTCSPIVDTQEYRDILHNQNKTLSDEDFNWFTENILVGESDAGVKDTSVTNETPNNPQSILDITYRQTSVLEEYYKEQVDKRSNYVRHLYFKEGDDLSKQNLIRWMLNGEGFPDNFTGTAIVSGDTFPTNPIEGDFFIRNDYSPERLFKRVGKRWRAINDVWRQEWVPAHRILESYINNERQTSIGIREDQTFDERQPVSKVILPKTKKDKSIVK